MQACDPAKNQDFGTTHFNDHDEPLGVSIGAKQACPLQWEVPELFEGARPSVSPELTTSEPV